MLKVSTALHNMGAHPGSKREPLKREISKGGTTEKNFNRKLEK